MPQLPVSLPALAAALMLLAPPSGMAADRKPDSTQPAAPKPAARQLPAKPAEPQFVAGIGDLPLMPGLSPVPEQDVVFDKPAGRIVQAVARGPVKPADVSRFYAETVPQLGWRAVGGG